jgi:hypothetical protein
LKKIESAKKGIIFFWYLDYFCISSWKHIRMPFGAILHILHLETLTLETWLPPWLLLANSIAWTTWPFACYSHKMWPECTIMYTWEKSSPPHELS